MSAMSSRLDFERQPGSLVLTYHQTLQPSINADWVLIVSDRVIYWAHLIASTLEFNRKKNKVNITLWMRRIGWKVIIRSRETNDGIQIACALTFHPQPPDQNV